MIIPRANGRLANVPLFLWLCVILPSRVVAQSEQWSVVRDSATAIYSQGHLGGGGIRGVAMTADSTLSVLVYPPGILKLFDQDGAHKVDVVRRSNGERFFKAPIALGILGDTLWVSDAGLGLTHLFSSDGRILGTLTISHVPSDSNYAKTAPLALLADGTVLFALSTPSEYLATARVTWIPLIRGSRLGSALDTLAWLDVRHRSLRLRGKPHARLSYSRQPLSDESLLAVSSAGTLIVTVDRLSVPTIDSASFRVTKISTRGDTIFSKLVSYRPQPISPMLVDSLIREISARSVVGATPLFYSLEMAERAVRQALYVPRYDVGVHNVVVGNDGSVWLKRGPNKWTVLGASGEVLADADLPANFELLLANGRVLWGVISDSTGVPGLVRYAVSTK